MTARLIHPTTLSGMALPMIPELPQPRPCAEINGQRFMNIIIDAGPAGPLSDVITYWSIETERVDCPLPTYETFLKLWTSPEDGDFGYAIRKSDGQLYRWDGDFADRRQLALCVVYINSDLTLIIKIVDAYDGCVAYTSRDWLHQPLKTSAQ